MLFFEEDHVLMITDLLEDELPDAVKSHMILQVELPGGVRIYPQFQFPELEWSGNFVALFQRLAPAMTHWEIACWINSHNDHLGETPLAATKRGRWSELMFVSSMINTLHHL